MRYATVVVRRMLTRLLDDWHGRRFERSAHSAWGHALRPALGPLLYVLVRRLLAYAVVPTRFMTVASPTPSGGPPGMSAASPQLPDATSRTRPTAPAAFTAATTDPAPAASAAPPAPTDRGIRARRRTAISGQPRRPGAHPVTLAALRGAASNTHSGWPFLAAGLGPIVHAAQAFARRPRPFATLLVPSSRRDDTAPAGAPRVRSMGWAAQQRLLGGAVAVLVLVASVVGVNPVHSPVAATGNVLGAGVGPRLAIGGGTISSGSDGSQGPDGGFGGLDGGTDGNGFAGFGVASGTDDPVANDVGLIAPDLLTAGGAGSDPSVPLQDIEGFTVSPGSLPAAIPGSIPGTITLLPDAIAGGLSPAWDAQPRIVTDSTNQGAFLADGTILKPIAVDTTAPDARTLLTDYKVRKGDTLTSIAHHFGLSLLTLYWANHLTTNLNTSTDLKVGRVLSVPPVNGVLHIVTDKETITDISKRTGVSVARIVDANGLTQPTVYVGQWIIVPGAKARPIPVAAPRPKPVVKPVPTPTASRPNPKPVARPVARPVAHPSIRPTYSGGGWVWPTPGGHISQYFHYGHWGLDIANDYGAPVLAAKPGVVTFAGWKNNGGGWQVWISHGNDLYTTYNHMSSVTVGGGQFVGAAQQVGRIGMTGHATGPHLHFEVWIGPIWNGGSRQNPLNYI